MHHLTSHTIPNSPAKKIDVVVGLDARGFLLGPIIALRLGAAFVPVRKRGKLPGQCVSATYEKEYGAVSLRIIFWIITGKLNFYLEGRFRNARGCHHAWPECHRHRWLDCNWYSCITYLASRIADSSSVGGSAKAAGELIAQRGCKTLEYLFIIELVFLKGHEKLDGPVYSIIQSND